MTFAMLDGAPECQQYERVVRLEGAAARGEDDEGERQCRERHQLEHVGRLRVEPDPRRDAGTDIEHDVDDQAEIAELLRLEAGGVPVSIGDEESGANTPTFLNGLCMSMISRPSAYLNFETRPRPRLRVLMIFPED